MSAATVSAVPDSVPEPIAAELRAAAADLDAAKAKRDRVIMKALKAGGSSRDIGNLVGLTGPGVLDVKKRMTGEPR